MPVYAFNPPQDNRPSAGESAVNLGNNLAAIYGNYQNQKREGEQQSKVKMLLEKLQTATPMEAVNIYEQIDPKLGLQYRIAQEKNAVKQQQMDVSKGIAQKHMQGAGGAQDASRNQLQDFLQGNPEYAPIIAQRGQANIPGATPPIVDPNSLNMGGGNIPQPAQQPSKMENLRNKSADLRNDALVASSVGDRGLASDLNSQADSIDADIRAEKKLDRSIYENEKSSAEKRNSAFINKIDEWRGSLPFSNFALNSAENAVRTGDFSALSKNNLANLLNRPELKDASAAQLDIALKQNFLDTISDVSARFGNKWMEQVTYSAFPGYGRSRGSNLTMVEALRANKEMKEIITNAADQIGESDRKILGFEGPDYQKRVYEAVKPALKEVQDRASYRTRVYFENELSKKSFNKSGVQLVPQGTPLTRKMMRKLIEETGSPASGIKRAKDLGYTIYPKSKVDEWSKDL